ncbi:MAG: hypothetical protein Q8J78_02530 [Moraxellaceae bacterium]|nr:hypothetical protein [Moraxellaceae bacterium]
MSTHPFDRLPAGNGQLIFTPCPGTQQTSVDDALQTLKAAGAGSLVTLMNDAELADNGVADMAERVAAAGLFWAQLPIADDAAPGADFDAAWRAASADLLARLAAGEGVAVHCKGGSGRTGLVIARLLMAQGEAHASAVERVQALRPKALRHPVHSAWLAQFA